MGRPHSDEIGAAEARRIALAAQGFDRPRLRAKPAANHIRGVIRRLGIVQLDFVNVLLPAHYQVLYSRLGPYPRQLFDRAVYRDPGFTEQWAHEACIVPVETWPLLRHRMATRRIQPYGFDIVMKQNQAYVEAVLAQVRTQGPLTADDLPAPDGISSRLPGTWVGTVPRAVLEAHFTRGLLAVTRRRPDFSRVYDLAQRVLPPEHHSREINHEEAQRELLRLAARAHGIGTAADLADYYRMLVRDARPRLQELVDANELRVVRVEGWREPAFLDPAARCPGTIAAATLLSPFDPLIWYRPRTSRLFGFEHRFEIFVPAAQRRWGCYVLPFLLGDRLVARVDLKADRSARRLLVPAAHIEPGTGAGVVASALAQELRILANWLELDAIAVGRRGGFAQKLSAAVRSLRYNTGNLEAT